MLYRRNSHTDVVRLHRLPNEVLSNIMRVGLEGSLDETARSHWLTTVSSTCALWRHISLGTPCLWTRVAFCLLEDEPGQDSDAGAEAYLARRIRCEFEMADAYFRRSGALRLHLTINWSSVDSMPRGVSQFVTLLSTHSHRIGSLVFRGQCAPDFLPGLEAPLPPDMPNLTSLEICSEIVDIGVGGVPRVFPTSHDLTDESGNIQLNYASPWHIQALHTPRLKMLSYRAYAPTRAFVDFVGRCEQLETLALSFDALPDGDRRRDHLLRSESVKKLVTSGDIWALDALLGSFPRLEHLTTVPRDIMTHDDPSQTLRHLSGGQQVLSFPMLRTLSLMPFREYSDEDLDFVLAQTKLEHLDLRDAYFPSYILEALVVPDPPSPNSMPSTPNTGKCHSTSDHHHSPRQSKSPSPSVSSTKSSTQIPTPFPNPSLRVLRLHRSHLNEETEEEWRMMTLLAQVLLVQRPSLHVHLVGGGNANVSVDDVAGQQIHAMRCDPTLSTMSRKFGGRVHLTAAEDSTVSCDDDGSDL